MKGQAIPNLPAHDAAWLLHW